LDDHLMASAGDRSEARELLDELAPPLLALPGVDWGRMFSSEGLRVRGKVFAFASRGNQLVVKLPAARLDQLVAHGDAEPMAMAGREMREWACVPVWAGPDRWVALLQEAHAFVDSITP
jgi:TfoX/Sxy family transcriptional regulator of competence genes